MVRRISLLVMGTAKPDNLRPRISEGNGTNIATVGLGASDFVYRIFA